MHKQKPKTKSHTKPKSFNPHQLLWIVPLGLVVVVGCVYLSWVLQAPQREQAAQIERLNANAAKLQEVKNKLEKELPNVKKASFEKSCGQASAKFSEGTITCGGYISVTVDGIIVDQLDEISNSVKVIIENTVGYVYKEEYEMTKEGDSTKASVWGASSLIGDESYGCKVLEGYYSKKSFYDVENHKQTDMEDGIYSVWVQCSEDTPDFIQGYTNDSAS